MKAKLKEKSPNQTIRIFERWKIGLSSRKISVSAQARREYANESKYEQKMQIKKLPASEQSSEKLYII